MTSISVIIPCYNRASMVGETIRNMLNQSLPPKEIIVVDDGSTDDSADVIASFGGIVRLVKQTNQGPGAARNAGLKIATGEFIQLMDSDDLSSLNKLETQAHALESSGADVAYCPWVRCRIADRAIQFTGKVLQGMELPRSRPMLEWFVAGWSLVFQNCLFRRSALDKAGLYRTDLMPSEDSEYFIRILLAGATPVFTPGCIVFYREHDQAKITGSGTTSHHRALDWTKYLTITGNLLKEKLNNFQFSTCVAAASHVQAHLKYCRNNGLPSLPNDNPYAQLAQAMPAPLCWLYSVQERMRRKVLNTTDPHPAFRATAVTPYYRELVTAMQYRVA